MLQAIDINPKIQMLLTATRQRSVAHRRSY